MIPTNLKLFNYKITGEPEEADHNQHYSQDIEDLLHKTYIQVQKNKMRSPVKLLKLIEKYPNVPAFKNYLTVYYNQKGKLDKAFQSNRWLAKEHPDYLFGKLNLVASCIQDDRLDEVPDIIGKALDLKDLYPEREVFHITEFQSFFGVSCQYLIAKGDFEAVETRIEVAEKVLGEDNPVIAQVYNAMMYKKIDIAEEREAAMIEKRGGKDIGRDYDKSVQTNEAPAFHHEEIWGLYKHGMAIEKDVLQNILSLPRETLIEDLKKVLDDSLFRFEFFKDKIEKEGWEDSEMSFPLHALFLLTELKATDELPFLLNHLKQGEEFLEFWYSDHKTETFWHFLFHLGRDQLSLLRSFMLERDIHYMAKWTVMSAVNQIGQHFPDKEREVLVWFESIMDEMIEHHEDPYFADPEVGGMLATDVCDFDVKHLYPKIKKLYDLGLANESIVGSYKEVIKEADEEDPIKYDIYDSIFDHYKHIVKEWLDIMTPEERAEKERKMQGLMKEYKMKYPDDPLPYSSSIDQGAQGTVKKTTSKIGRNDPCTCGSGKKYKKCCMNK